MISTVAAHARAALLLEIVALVLYLTSLRKSSSRSMTMPSRKGGRLSYSRVAQAVMQLTEANDDHVAPARPAMHMVALWRVRSIVVDGSRATSMVSVDGM